MNITATDLDLADDRRYTDILVKEAMQNGALWTLMLAEERVDRTHEILIDLKASIEQQLGQARLFQKGGDPDWRKRTVNLLRRVDLYVIDVKAEIKRLDREEYSESVTGQMERWKEIARTLADLLDGNPALELIRLPDGDVTVAEWRAKHTAKIARRAVAA